MKIWPLVTMLVAEELLYTDVVVADDHIVVLAW